LNIHRDEDLLAFRNVVRSLMKDAARVVDDAHAAGVPRELRERLDLVGHYIDYTLRYCDECPLIHKQPMKYPPFTAQQFPEAS